MHVYSNYENKSIGKLSEEPYKSHLLLWYDKLNSIKRFRKKIQEIEKEISWFNGVHAPSKRPDHSAFYDHLLKYYFDANNTTIAPKYKAIFEYTYGEEPLVLYFVMLYIKRLSDKEQFEEKYSVEALDKDRSLAEEYLKIHNEWSLLFGLLEKMEGLVLAVVNSMELTKVKHLDEDVKELDSVTLKHRFLAAVSRREKNTAFKLLGRLRDLDDGEDYYLEAIAHYNSEEYDEALRYARKVNPEEIDYPSAAALIMECYVNKGDFSSFIKYFEENMKGRISASYLLYLLQELILNADFQELEDEELLKLNEEEIDNKIDPKQDPAMMGKVIRNFVKMALEGINIVNDFFDYKSLAGKTDIPDKIQSRLDQLDLALSLYTEEDICKYIDLEYAEKNGLGHCKEKLREWALTILINKNPDKSFENIYQALMVHYRLGFVKKYIEDIEKNLTNLQLHGANGENKAYELIRLAYNEGSLLRIDTNKFLEALKKANINMENASSEIKAKKIFSILAENGKIAYNSAEWMYNKAMEEDYGWKDAGMISLSYFRILEVEFNEKIITPLIASISINDLEDKFKEHQRKLYGRSQEDYRRKWGTIIGVFRNSKSPYKEAEGLMLGPLEYFFRNLGKRYDKDDQVTLYLKEGLGKFLSEAGKTALENGSMESIMSYNNRNQYRNPPAHTKYLHIDKAMECRDFVNESILNIGEWIR